MPRTILTDSTVKKGDRETHTRIKDIATPEVSAVLYRDNHPDAGKGLYLKVDNAGLKSWVLVDYPNGNRRVTTLDYWPAWGPARARIEASKERDEIRAGRGRAAVKSAQAKATEVRLAKSELTLGNLLLAYVAELERKGKYEARAVKNSLLRNVKAAHPAKWEALADELTMPDFRDIIATLVQAEKYREAQKLRAYLRAAYAAAIGSHNNAAAAPELRQFDIQANPARDVAPVEKPKGKASNARKALTLAELRNYWKRISALPGPDGAILRLHLLTGGQRLRQLCRLAESDVDENVIILRDAKGRRTEERLHMVPLIPEAQTALAAIGKGPFMVSLDNGETPADPWEVSKRVKVIAQAMFDAGEAQSVFTGKMIRATVETRLTEAKVTPHILSHLLSHGLGTVQEKHYQHYDFATEKREALQKLCNLLIAPAGDVVPMKRRAKN